MVSNAYWHHYLLEILNKVTVQQAFTIRLSQQLKPNPRLRSYLWPNTKTKVELWHIQKKQHTNQSRAHHQTFFENLPGIGQAIRTFQRRCEFYSLLQMKTHPHREVFLMFLTQSVSAQPLCCFPRTGGAISVQLWQVQLLSSVKVLVTRVQCATSPQAWEVCLFLVAHAQKWVFSLTPYNVNYVKLRNL